MVSSAGPASGAPQSTFHFFLQELKPKGKFLTPFNIISLPVILLGLVLTIIRFTQGLGSVTNLNQQFPWGFWIGFDVVCGVAFAAGAYVITFVVYIMNAEKYHPIVRITVLNGFLAYVFYAGALMFDLGRPWNIINPMIGNDFGYNSVLFLVAWHFMLYMITALIEFAPAIAEWLGMRRMRRVLKAMTVGAVIFGITLSMLHQSGLGALFLMAKPKIHPLWYSEFIPILFFVSSIFAGLSMIIVEGTISHRVFGKIMDAEHHKGADEIVIGLARGAAIAMFVYYFFKTTLFLHDEQWRMMGDFWGHWFLLEVIGLVLVPCFMFAYGARNRDLSIIRVAAILTILGVVLNRLNISIIAFNWFVPDHYYPSWQEIIITLMIVFAEIWALRWVVLRMPVLRKAPGFA
jgi:Ni/Fe-hydrogenase subunit HybB-like protein